tara:strand:+ start:8195 stop:9193 length:999 start_codon:yes stop_codon:yes gene_type:complete
MTYQGIVDNFRAICDAHEIIKEFGYGAISDIKTMNVDAGINSFGSPDYAESQTLYPYVYLVPGQSTRTSQMITYRFNMIVMDTVLDNGLEVITSFNQQDQRDPPYGTTLEVQSSCQQYVDDILAQLRLAHDGGSLRNPLLDAQLSVNLTPFKERFQDTVAGMTATIELEVAAPLNLCIAPIKDQLPLLLDTIAVGNIDNFDYNYGQINTWDIPKATATYRIEWNFRVSQNVPLVNVDPSPYQYPGFTIFEDSQPYEPGKYLAVNTWVSNETEETTLRGQVEFTTRDDDPDDRRVFFGFGYIGATYPNGDPVSGPISNAINTRNGSIRIYKVN